MLVTIDVLYFNSNPRFAFIQSIDFFGICLQTNIQTYIHTYIHKYIHTYCTYIHIYIHKYIHTYIHTYRIYKYIHREYMNTYIHTEYINTYIIYTVNTYIEYRQTDRLYIQNTYAHTHIHKYILSLGGLTIAYTYLFFVWFLLQTNRRSRPSQTVTSHFKRNRGGFPCNTRSTLPRDGPHLPLLRSVLMVSAFCRLSVRLILGDERHHCQHPASVGSDCMALWPCVALWRCAPGPQGHSATGPQGHTVALGAWGPVPCAPVALCPCGLDQCLHH